MFEAVLDADAVLLVTEWKEFRVPPWGVVRKSMRGNTVIDGRNIYGGAELNESHLNYYCIGKRPYLV